MEQKPDQRVLVDFVRMAEQAANLAAAGIVKDSGLVGREAAELMDVASKIYTYSIVAASGLDHARIAEAFKIIRRPYEGGKKIPIGDGNEIHAMHVQYPHSAGRLNAVGM